MVWVMVWSGASAAAVGGGAHAGALSPLWLHVRTVRTVSAVFFPKTYLHFRISLPWLASNLQFAKQVSSGFPDSPP